jgi:hypothetical protein
MQDSLFENLIVIQLVKVLFAFCGSLLCLQESTTGPYPESFESNPQPHILFL